jgi:hypothetical protein
MWTYGLSDRWVSFAEFVVRLTVLLDSYIREPGASVLALGITGHAAYVAMISRHRGIVRDDAGAELLKTPSPTLYIRS